MTETTHSILLLILHAGEVYQQSDWTEYACHLIVAWGWLGQNMLSSYSSMGFLDVA